MNHKDWDFVNRRLVAKMLSEMEYEQVFHAESQGDDHYCINLPGAQWRFIAERGIWDCRPGELCGLSKVN